jgi:integrating conjugative element protein (TIGR03761 family)
MANESLQLNLGSLRSAMTLTLHTHHASRIWHGRAAAEGRPGIVGLNGYVAVMNKMKRGSEQDDPYSDWWMLRIEEKLEQTKTTLQSLREQVEQALAGVPAALSLGENLNVQPVKLPLFVNAQLGFAAVYLLADYDDIARKLILAHHTALIDRRTLEDWLNEGAHALRSLFSLAQKYRFSGATRDDFAAKNAVARAALEKLGELPQDVLEGTRRSRFAPPVIRRSPLTASRHEPVADNDSAAEVVADEHPVETTTEAPAPTVTPKRSRKLVKTTPSDDGGEAA